MAIIPCGSTIVARWGICPQHMLRSYAMNKTRTAQYCVSSQIGSLGSPSSSIFARDSLNALFCAGLSHTSQRSRGTRFVVRADAVRIRLWTILSLECREMQLKQKLKMSQNMFTMNWLFLSSDSEADAELELNNVHEDATTIDIQLPRRNLLVKFTCNLCNERTSKLVNRLAYEKGLVYVQCAGCLKYHKLVDKLSLVVEYDLRGDRDLDSSADDI